MASTHLKISNKNDSDSEGDSSPRYSTSPRSLSPLKSPRKHITVEHRSFEDELNEIASNPNKSPSRRSSVHSKSPSGSASIELVDPVSDDAPTASTNELEDALHETIKAYFLTDNALLPEAGYLAPAVDTSVLSHPPTTMTESAWQNSKFAAMDPHMKAFLSIRVQAAMNICVPVFFEFSMTAKQALQILAENHFLSAPLRDPGGLILGFVDVIGLLGLLLVNETFGDSPLLLPTETLGELISRSWLPLIPPSLVRSDDSLYRAIQMMSEGHHRLLVTDPQDNSVVGLITQSDIAGILNKYPILLGLRATETIAHSHAFNASPESIPDTSSMLSAIARITKNHHPALAVVNARGLLVGNFSASSVKGLTDGDISQLHDSIANFFAANPTIHQLHTLKPNATLFQAIHMIAENRAHRIWIAETTPEGLQLQGLLTITDIFKSLVQPSLN